MVENCVDAKQTGVSALCTGGAVRLGRLLVEWGWRAGCIELLTSGNLGPVPKQGTVTSSLRRCKRSAGTGGPEVAELGGCRHWSDPVRLPRLTTYSGFPTGLQVADLTFGGPRKVVPNFH